MGCAIHKTKEDESVAANSDKKKIIIIGRENAGKTQILYQLK
jgi:GTP-binding protein EngB required for normal cell division